MNSSDEDNFESRQSKKPEFIIIEDSQEFVHGAKKSRMKADFEDAQFHHSTIKLDTGSLKHALIMRCVSLFFGGVAIFCALVSLLLTALCLISATASFFQNSNVNRLVLSCWAMVKVFLVCLAGSFLGIFSPALGMGLVVLYFSMKADAASPMMMQMIKRMLQKNQF